jgi:CheY-like chemotaxis protein
MNLSKNKILLIDDEELVNKLNHYIVSSTNRFDSIEISTNPIDTINYLSSLIDAKESLPGYILIDLSMPELDGFELVDEIDVLFENNGINELPVFIILSSSLYKRDFEKFENNPTFKRFLSKPLVKEEFLEALGEN